MTVKELRKILADAPDDAVILVPGRWYPDEFIVAGQTEIGRELILRADYKDSEDGDMRDVVKIFPNSFGKC